jgi:acetyl esterase/lipase
VDTTHLVDPELLDTLQQLPPLQLTPEALPVVREQLAAAPPPPLPDGVTEEEVFVPREGKDPVRVLVHRPAGTAHDAPGLLWIHGGGYLIGSPDADRAQTGTYAQLLGAVVVSVDYGLSPENVAPGPVEDCYAALRWLHDHADDLGVDRSRLAVGGASAGGGLAACLALLARDRGEVPLVLQFLVYPMLDDRTVTAPDPNPTVGQFIWTPEFNAFGWRSLLGGEPGADGVSPYAAAARAEDLAGLPPTFLEVGSLDLFLEEDVEYARRLTRAGVPTELHVYPGAFHGYQMVVDAEVTRTSFQLGTSALRRALRPGDGETPRQDAAGRATVTG